MTTRLLAGAPLFVGLLLASACHDERSGVSIGNPNKNTLLRVAPPGDGLELDAAEVQVVGIVLVGPEGETRTDPPSDRDVLAGVDLGLPAGAWTAVELELRDAFLVTGTDRGARLDLALEVPEVAVSATRLPFELGEPHVFELGFPGWLSAEQVGWMAGDEHVVRRSDPEHDRLVELVTERSALLVDADGNGEPDR